MEFVVWIGSTATRASVFFNVTYAGAEEDERDGISTGAHVGRREEQRWIHVVSSNHDRMVVSGNSLFFGGILRGRDI